MLCQNHDIVLPLLKDWRSLQRAVEKRLRELHTIYRVVWTLLPHIFGTLDVHGYPLKPVTAASYDILKTIAFKFLSVNPSLGLRARAPPARRRAANRQRLRDFGFVHSSQL